MKNILIINENEDVCKDVGAIFEAHEWGVDVRVSTLDLLPLIARNDYNAIILPVLSGGISGLQGLSAIREVDSVIKVVLMGEDMTDVVKKEAVGVGAFGLLNVPIEDVKIELLIMRIEQEL